MQIILSAIYFEKRKETCKEGLGENFARDTDYLSVLQDNPAQAESLHFIEYVFYFSPEFKRMLGSNTVRTTQKLQ
jgi:hypothetical protein